MKKTLLLSLGAAAIALAVFSFQSCNKLTSLVHINPFTMTVTDTIVIPVASDTANVQAAGSYYNIDSMIKSQSNNVGDFSYVKSVKVDSINFTLLNADNQNNFANFDYVLATFNSDAQNGSLPGYALALVQDNPDVYSNTMTLAPPDPTQDVKQYFASKTTFSFLFVGKLRRPTTHTLTCIIVVNYKIGF